MKKFQWLLLSVVFVFFIVQSVTAKDTWIRVQSKNFNLIGNASDRDIRQVATRLEQFREVFRQLFANVKFNTAIQTNVIVFKDNSSYRPFKPKRADGKIDDFLAGYFQPGEDINYITLSTEREDAQTFEVIFHEYVHSLVNTNIGKSEVPTWFNEGLAEYYSTFQIEDNQKVKLGIFKEDHINLLSNTKLLPLETLFSVSNFQLHQQGNHTRGIFYAESWALIHYFMQNGKGAELGKFLQALMKGVAPDQAFQDSFQMTYPQMEKQLNNYVKQSAYKYINISLKEKLTFDSEMKTFPVSEAVADAYLGDLLYHIQRPDDAEAILQKSIALDDKQSAAYATLGMVRFRQAKFDEAQKYLERAVSDDGQNAIAYYYYAVALSRGEDDGYGSRFSAEKTTKMRDALKKAITLNPTFAPSYDMLGFVDLVTGENLDEAMQYLRKALAIEPGNQRFALRIAEIYFRQEKLAEAKSIADKIAATTDDPQIKSQAEDLKGNIENFRENRARFEAEQKQYEETAKENRDNRIKLSRRENQVEKTVSAEEIARQNEETEMISLNQSIHKPVAGEKQFIGRITKISCVGGKIIYSVKTEKEIFSLTSKDFESLTLTALSKESESAQVGCNAELANFNTVLTYKETTAGKSNVRGELTAIDFVPEKFRLFDAEKVLKTDSSNNSTASDSSADPEALKMQAIKNSMRQLLPGEKRELGYIEKVECGTKGMLFYFKTDNGIIKVSAATPSGLQIRAYTREIQQSQFGCAMKQIDVPTVFTYKPNADIKSNIAGEVTALEFMPKGFKL